MADNQPTCGKGLAANAVLPEKLAAPVKTMAALLDNHVRALDPREAAGRLERNAYERLVKDQRTLASGLEDLAIAMEGYRDLPTARTTRSIATADSKTRPLSSAFAGTSRTG
jgi:hypothetical protein